MADLFLVLQRQRWGTAGAVKNPTAPIQVCASSTDMTSAETKTALCFILDVDTVDIRLPMVLVN